MQLSGNNDWFDSMHIKLIIKLAEIDFKEVNGKIRLALIRYKERIKK